MGCGASSQFDGSNADIANPRRMRAAASNKNSTGGPLATSSGVEGGATLLGKQRYIGDSGAVAMEVSTGIVLVFTTIDYNGLAFAYRDSATRELFVQEYSDVALVKERAIQRITLSWPSLFKSIAADLMKLKAVLGKGSVATKRELYFSITSKEKTDLKEPFTIRLDLKSKSPSHIEVFRYLTEPLTRMVQIRRERDQEKELRCARAENDQIVRGALVSQSRKVVDAIVRKIRPLQDDVAKRTKATSDLQTKVTALERRIKRADVSTSGGNKGQHALDRLYSEGGAQHFQHTVHSDDHTPQPQNPSEEVADLIAHMLPSQKRNVVALYEGGIQKTPGDPKLKRLYEGSPHVVVQGVLKALTRLERWDTDMFELERDTDGNAMFYTSYAMLHKLDFISTFNIDDRTLRNFLKAVQSGYHPNPYHNKTHAADVAQINYFMIVSCGLQQSCQLSNEEVLAAIIAGIIHDYDHPGFNNNFHTRTNAYLSTLYNDRSILENHHCACVFEILRLPQYDIFKTLSDDQRRVVRETMIEMVLATDMGNHAKIFSSFRRRLSDGQDWHERRDDVLLALSMSIKMADVSNCGRPKFLYLEWAKNIATEFYGQGDAEERRGLSVSPFMDRNKDKVDFPKGQISFMNYVVVPMFEAIAEFLPPVECALQCCTENKEYWQHLE